MKVFSIAKGFYRLSKNTPPELSQKEFDRLRALTIYTETGDVKLVCQAFGISRATLYRWLKRFDPKDLNFLKEELRRPWRVRKPLWSRELVEVVKELRQEYPRWGKDKIVVLVRDQGQEVSTSTVGRILRHLKQRGELKEPKEEFYEVYKCSWNVTDLNPELRHWEYIYGCLRPHQALSYKTPLQFLRDSGIVDSNYPSNPSHM